MGAARLAPAPTASWRFPAPSAPSSVPSGRRCCCCCWSRLHRARRPMAHAVAHATRTHRPATVGSAYFRVAAQGPPQVRSASPRPAGNFKTQVISTATPTPRKQRAKGSVDSLSVTVAKESSHRESLSRGLRVSALPQAAPRTARGRACAERRERDAPEAGFRRVGGAGRPAGPPPVPPPAHRARG